MCWGWTTSGIVYFWQGGVTVKYHILNPTTGDYKCIYLGPNLIDGNVMQVFNSCDTRGSQTPFCTSIGRLRYVTLFMGKDRP